MESKKANIWSAIKEWVQVIGLALVISLPIRFFIAEPFVVNGASMDPTFSSGQFLIVDRLTYRFDEPKRGDVIVFEYPNDPDTYFIKRIIGLPNETIRIINGKVGLAKSCNPNATSTVQALDEPYIESIHASFDTLCVELGNTEYFVMGDNRAQSSDSRSWGPLEKGFIVGRPLVRLLPVTKMSILPGEHHE